MLLKDEIVTLIGNFAVEYTEDVCYDQLKGEMLHLKVIHSNNFGSVDFHPLNLLNKIVNMKLEEIFQSPYFTANFLHTLIGLFVSFAMSY